MVMMLLSCTGLLGLASFLWLFGQAVCLTLKERLGHRTGLVVWPVAYLVIGVTGFNVYHSWYQAVLAFWLVFIGAKGGRATAENDER
jgi:O-antigen ligase